jgi:TonB family protein
MKHVIKLILCTSFLATAAYCAPSPEEAYVESFAGRTNMPVPISVVRPIIQPGHEGEVVQLSFLIGANGTPTDIMAPVSADRALVKQLARAVEQWKFKPLVRDGEVVRVRVTLPFIIGPTTAVPGDVAQR